MVTIIVFVVTLFLLLMFGVFFVTAIVKKYNIFGRPPVPVFYFVLAKILVLVNMVFLIMRGLNIKVNRIIGAEEITDIAGIVFLIPGTVILFLTILRLRKDLVFGLSDSEEHKLQTNGVYSFSRHPFYLGFLFVLFASCLFSPHIVNIIAFAGAWLIHHFIMIKEEQFLLSKYGESYKKYTENVRRYINF